MTPKRRAESAEELTDAQRRELLDNGWPWLGGWDVSAFPSEEARREAWEAHRGELMEAYISEHPGTRPEAWWAYDAPEGHGRNRPIATVGDVPDKWIGFEPEVANLDELGELTDDEEARLRERGPLWGPGSTTSEREV